MLIVEVVRWGLAVARGLRPCVAVVCKPVVSISVAKIAALLVTIPRHYGLRNDAKSTTMNASIVTALIRHNAMLAAASMWRERN